MKNKEVFSDFCKAFQIDLEILTYEQLVENEGEDGIEDFTGKEVSKGEEVYWFSDSEPLFYVVNQEADLTEKDIQYMLLYCSNLSAFQTKDIFETYKSFSMNY